jgi:predicted transposase/invertase (TIGR01784 family)
MALGIKPTVDFAFKRIFGSPENEAALVGLLNAVLELPEPITAVEILNPFSYQEFAEQKQIVLDVRARDETGRWLNIEMQVTTFGGLPQRLVYYACSLYVDQLQAGDSYYDLQPAISICLLTKVLFSDTPVAHHRFRLTDERHGRVLDETVEVHTVELTKYNVTKENVAGASPLGQWAFFLLYADRYDGDRLRELLPGPGFEVAIRCLETIAARTEDRMMYDQREKARRDYEWIVESARREGVEQGLQQGLQQGLEQGLERGLQQGLERGLQQGLERGLQQGLERGLQQGRQEGLLLGKVQVLKQLLGEEPPSVESLQELSIEELCAMVDQLQQRLRSRGER